jgi:hypothetical protein
VHGHAEVDEEMACGVGEAGRAANVGLGVGAYVGYVIGPVMRAGARASPDGAVRV